MRALYKLGVLALVVSCGVRAAEEKKAPGLVVHEWGTFTGISGSDGVPLQFYPTNNDLPPFATEEVLLLKMSLNGTVSLETPVTYFYAREALKVRVKAEFPGGVFTNWYPHAKSTRRERDGVIEWNEVEVLPGQKADLPGAGEKGRYFLARDAGANLLRVKSEKKIYDTHNIEKVEEKTQYEQFLFYRGVGHAKLPVRVVNNSTGVFEMENVSGDTIADYFAVHVKDRKLQFLHGSELKPGATGRFDFRKVSGEGDALDEALVKALVAQGLYEKEARAMVATWRDAWFEEEGTRVLYLLTEKASGELLPLQVDPQPDELVRVMVGRQDIFTREQESEFKKLQADLSYGFEAARNEAEKTFAKLGRFAGPAKERGYELMTPIPWTERAEQCIKILADESFQNREEAQKKLLDMGSEVLPALKSALEHTRDAEVQRRISTLLSDIERSARIADALRKVKANPQDEAALDVLAAEVAAEFSSQPLPNIRAEDLSTSSNSAVAFGKFPQLTEETTKPLLVKVLSRAAKSDVTYYFRAKERAEALAGSVWQRLSIQLSKALQQQHK